MSFSHELRTPLTLIIGPLSNILQSHKISSLLRTKLEHINDNAKRLLSLTNHLMDFRKVDLGKQYIQVSEGDLKTFISDIKEAFDDVAEEEGITFDLSLAINNQPIWFDHSRLERILFNLLSNAFKYTEEQGSISLSAKHIQKEWPPFGHCELMEFQVADTGKGIPSELLDRIFERFFRSDAGKKHQGGSGIGLAFANNLRTPELVA